MHLGYILNIRIYGQNTQYTYCSFILNPDTFKVSIITCTIQIVDSILLDYYQKTYYLKVKDPVHLIFFLIFGGI